MTICRVVVVFAILFVVANVSGALSQKKIKNVFRTNLILKVKVVRGQTQQVVNFTISILYEEYRIIKSIMIPQTQ
jgi:hypothetical protein